jgi:hypothetical protein
LVTKQKFVVEDQNSMNEDIDSYDRRVVQQWSHWSVWRWWW